MARLDALERYVGLNEWQIAEIQAGIDEADAGDFAAADEVLEVFGRYRP